MFGGRISFQLHRFPTGILRPEAFNGNIFVIKKKIPRLSGLNTVVERGRKREMVGTLKEYHEGPVPALGENCSHTEQEEELGVRDRGQVLPQGVAGDTWTGGRGICQRAGGL